MAKSEQLFERLKQKSSYKNFISNHPNAYLYAIFSILSKEEKEGDKIQFDFIIPDKENERVAITEYPFNEVKVSLQKINPVPKELNFQDLKIDIEELQEIIEEIKKEKQEKFNINKIIAIYKETLWDITCLTTTLDVVKMKINSLTKEVTNYKKENLANFVQVRKK